MLRPISAIIHQSRSYMRNFILQKGFDDHLVNTKANPKLWERLSLFVALPIVILGSINLYLIEKEHAEHETEEDNIIIEADYMGIMRRPFPWRDGKKPLFYNPKYKRVRPE